MSHSRYSDVAILLFDFLTFRSERDREVSADAHLTIIAADEDRRFSWNVYCRKRADGAGPDLDLGHCWLFEVPGVDHRISAKTRFQLLVY